MQPRNTDLISTTKLEITILLFFCYISENKNFEQLRYGTFYNFNNEIGYLTSF